VREAVNGHAALDRIAREGGLRVRLLSAEEEARYGWLGAVNSTTLADGFVLDLGGGSVQVSRVRARLMERSTSLPLGAVRMTEAFLPGRTASRAALARLRRHVRERLAPLPWFARSEGRIVGQGGSLRTLAAMAARRSAYPLDEVHGFRLGRDELGALIEDMAALPVERRDRLPGLKTDRADILLAGAVTIDAALAHAGAERLEVCSQGLRHGLFYERFLAPREPPLFEDVRREGVLNLAMLFAFDRVHADRVAALAEGLYGELVRIGLQHDDSREREWLWAASMLHDIGAVVDYNDHHKHGYYLVLNAGLPGFRHRELALVALLVRAHRKAPPGLNGLDAVLERGDDARLLRLAACLRIAEQLERGRAGRVLGVRCDPADGAVRLAVRAEGDPRVAVWSAEQEADAFARAFGPRLDVVPAQVSSASSPPG
jgi:exopolyphosphatase/guanosine-5'-triphosphate,3'-diphosphate pyrophosphatase